MKAAVLTGERRIPYLLYKPDGTPLDFSFLPITQYGLSAVGREMSSFSELLDAFYAQRDAAERSRQWAHDMLRVLTNASDRLIRKNGASAGGAFRSGIGIGGAYGEI